MRENKEYRIYHKGKLVNISCSSFVAMSNLINYHKRYGKENITTKVIDGTLNDEEKREFLKTIRGFNYDE